MMEKSPLATSRARILRHNQTEAELKLWGCLRDRRLANFKFRRQFPIPPYIADFACLSHGLIVEVDGATHGDAHEMDYDQRRTEFLESKGFIVFRMNNNDVFTNMTGALDGILLVLKNQKK